MMMTNTKEAQQHIESIQNKQLCIRTDSDSDASHPDSTESSIPPIPLPDFFHLVRARACSFSVCPLSHTFLSICFCLFLLVVSPIAFVCLLKWSALRRK